MFSDLRRLTKWLAMLGMALSLKAQTNSLSGMERFFVPPAVHLRAEFAEASVKAVELRERKMKEMAVLAQPTPTKSEARRSDTYAVSMTGSADGLQSLQSFKIIPPPKSSGNFIESAFRTEVYHVGKTKISCSLLTAIKRKNPLCLLNPIFLNISW